MRGYHPRTCVRCGAVVKGTIRRQYCSPKCKVYAYRERRDAERKATSINLNNSEVRSAILASAASYGVPPEHFDAELGRVPMGEG